MQNTAVHFLINSITHLQGSCPYLKFQEIHCLFHVIVLYYRYKRECCPANGLRSLASHKNDRSVCETGGGHFLLPKIFQAMSNIPKPTVAISVSRAKVSKSVMVHPPFRSEASGVQQCRLPDTVPKSCKTACRMWAALSYFKYNRHSVVFQQKMTAQFSPLVRSFFVIDLPERY